MGKYTIFAALLIIILSSTMLFAKGKDTDSYLSDAAIADIEGELLKGVPNHSQVPVPVSPLQVPVLSRPRQVPVPVSPRQVPVPVSPRQVPVPVSPRQVPVPVSPRQVPVPVSPRQVPVPVSPPQVPVPVSPRQVPVPVSPPQVSVPVSPQKVSTKTPPEKILSKGVLPREVLIDFLLANNPALERRRAWTENLIDRYILEAGHEGVNYEIAFAQICYHTDYLKFGTSFISLEMNNFCGLISSSSNRRAYKFNTLWEGVRAHIQHLKGYATEEPLTSRLVDPRYWAIEETFGFGSAPALSDLDGKWAGPGYVRKIKKILTALYDQ